MLFSSNCLQFVWNLLSVGIGIYGILVIYLPNGLPNVISAVYRYGKTAKGYKTSPMTQIFTLPKSWFKHFYIVACMFHSFLLWTLYQVYFRKRACPEFLSFLLRSFSSQTIAHNILPEDVVISLLLMIMQVFRRLFECFFVSVYSDAKMSIIHYGFGLFFYVAVGISLILEAPGFLANGTVSFTGAWFTPGHILGTALFLYGWYIELESHLILADIRKPKQGEVMKNKYSIPEGGLFDLVSSPHYFGEIIMYFAICFVYGWHNYTFITAFVTVLVNQIMAALMSHEWYHNTFKSYPSKRKVLIPYIF